MDQSVFYTHAELQEKFWSPKNNNIDGCWACYFSCVQYADDEVQQRTVRTFSRFFFLSIVKVPLRSPRETSCSDRSRLRILSLYHHNNMRTRTIILLCRQTIYVLYYLPVYCDNISFLLFLMYTRKRFLPRVPRKIT